MTRGVGYFVALIFCEGYIYLIERILYNKLYLLQICIVIAVYNHTLRLFSTVDDIKL